MANRKIVNKLKYKKLEEQHMKAIMRFLNNEINWLQAHNILIAEGINLTSTGELLDY